MSKNVSQCVLLPIKYMVVVFLGVSSLACQKAESKKDIHDSPIDIRDMTIRSVVIYEDGDDLNPFKRYMTIIGAISCGVEIEYLICNSDNPSVLVFRGIPNAYKEANVRIGSAYLQSQNGLRYIRTVDLSLSSIRIAESYGVHPENTKEVDIGSYARGKVIDKETGEAKNAVVIPDLKRVLAVGEHWRGEGVFIK